MYRPRLEVTGDCYHVGARGNNKEPIFLDDEDRRIFLLRLGRAARRHGWVVHAYVLMSNHYHLLIQLGDLGLSRGMCELNGGYAQSFNARHRRINHVFGRRFWDERITSDSQYHEVCRYVALNPLRGGLERELGTWPWSSYPSTIEAAFAPAFLASGELLARFGTTPAAARRAFIRYVSEGRVQRQPPEGLPPT